jgi:hypothetical protein
MSSGEWISIEGEKTGVFSQKKSAKSEEELIRQTQFAESAQKSLQIRKIVKTAGVCEFS